jgi:type IV pilus assembly protein PilE
MKGDVKMQGKSSGFTLIELMVVVVVVAIIAAIATPSYINYVRRLNANQAEQAVLNLAAQLERHKAKNFSYRGFNIESQDIPLGSNNIVRYSIDIVSAENPHVPLTDPDVSGRGWAIRAASTDPLNFSYLLRSDGTSCRNKAVNNITFNNCGGGGEAW